MSNNHGGARPGSGRPKGSTNNLKFRELLNLHGEEIIQVVIDKARSGDIACLKLCFERLIPNIKSVEISGNPDNQTPLIIRTN